VLELAEHGFKSLQFGIGRACALPQICVVHSIILWSVVGEFVHVSALI
jgi:hypothetical protein